MSDIRKFWMVLGSGAPTYRHYRPDDARTEATRLARQNPGQEFILLEAIGAVRKTDVEWLDASDEADIPF